MRPELGAMSILVTVLSCPFNSSFNLKVSPDFLYSSMDVSRAMARVDRSAEKEWSAIGLWKRWWTSGAGILKSVLERELEGCVIGVALYYHEELLYQEGNM